MKKNIIDKSLISFLCCNFFIADSLFALIAGAVLFVFYELTGLNAIILFLALFLLFFLILKLPSMILYYKFACIRNKNSFTRRLFYNLKSKSDFRYKFLLLIYFPYILLVLINCFLSSNFFENFVELTFIFIILMSSFLPFILLFLYWEIRKLKKSKKKFKRILIKYKRSVILFLMYFLIFCICFSDNFKY